MGLAASQARLLTITSRKADCEFMSMTLSHQKLSLSRDMEAISSEYQKALTATKLVYDYQSEGSREMKLTYDLLMSPSVYNDYYPKLVTDTKNRVILDSAYAAAARAAGIPAEGLAGTPSSDVRNKFVQALAGNSIITPATASKIQAVQYGNTLGLGNTISVSTSYDELSYKEFLDRIKSDALESTSDYGMTLGLNTKSYRTSKEKWRHAQEEVWVDGELQMKAPEKEDSDPKNPAESVSLTLHDLLTSDVILHYNTNRSEQTPVYEAAKLQEEIVGTGGILDWMLDQFSTVLGGININDTALQYAYDQVYDLVMPNSNLQKIAMVNGGKKGGPGKGGSDLDERTEWKDSVDGLKIADVMTEVGEMVRWGDVSGYNAVGSKASDYLGFVFSAKNKDNGDDGKDHTAVAINISNLAQAFLTSYVQYMQGVENSEYNWDKGNVTASNLYDGNVDKEFKFNTLSDTEIDNGGNDLYAAFYDTLFNLICTKGWVQNDQINDSEYMSEMLKNGMAFVSSISDDGYYYQNTYSNEKNILEVADNEAIAQAEAKYNSEKSKIENKEETLDLKMKNLDTEISSLNQEYETVKNLVSKGVEKSFKRYEA